MWARLTPADGSVPAMPASHGLRDASVAISHRLSGVGHRFGSLMTFALGAADPLEQGTP